MKRNDWIRKSFYCLHSITNYENLTDVNMGTYVFLESTGQGLYCNSRGHQKNGQLKKIQFNQEPRTDFRHTKTGTGTPILCKHLVRVFLTPMR